MTLQKQHPNRPFHHRGARCRGFSLIEILIVVGIIVTLVTILIVAMSAVQGKAASARTQAIMAAMSQGMASFENDFGGLPPVLQANRDWFQPPTIAGANPTTTEYDNLQDWWSITSPADYLLGYGSAGADGAAGLGIRNPGNDLMWGASRDPNTNGTPGEYVERNPNTNGQVYGPYMELQDDKFVGRLDIVSGDIFLPGEPDYDTLGSGAPHVIVDYWGEPIRYYQAHPLDAMNLSDVVALRPYSLKEGADTNSPYADGNGSTATSFALKGAPYAFLSTGPDLAGNAEFRIDDPSVQPDTRFANEDNIVEAGR